MLSRNRNAAFNSAPSSIIDGDCCSTVAVGQMAGHMKISPVAEDEDPPTPTPPAFDLRGVVGTPCGHVVAVVAAPEDTPDLDSSSNVTIFSLLGLSVTI